MRTKQLIAAAGIAACLALVLSACSSSSETATTTSAVVKSSDGGGGSGGGSEEPATDDASVALPDDWPDALALPDDLVVTEATDMTGGHSWVVVARVDGDPKETLDQFESQLAAADWTIVNSDFTESPQGGFGGVSATGRQQTVAISLGPDSKGDITEVQISLADKTST